MSLPPSKAILHDIYWNYTVEQLAFDKTSC